MNCCFINGYEGDVDMKERSILIQRQIRYSNHLKLQLQRIMCNNYEKLFEELTELISDKEVQHNLDDHLKSRIENLLQNRNNNKNQPLSNRICSTDSQRLFKDGEIEKPSNDFNLTDCTNTLKMNKRQNFNSTALITDKKIGQISKNSYMTFTKLNKNLSQEKVIPKNQSKSKTKNLIKYSTMVADKQKSKQKYKSKGTSNQCSIKYLKTANKSKSKQKFMGKTDLYEKVQKQNIKGLLPHQIHKKKKQVSEFIPVLGTELKIKNKNSKTNQSREILKRLATLETEPSRISFHSNVVQRSTDNLSHQRRSIQKRILEKRSIGKEVGESKKVIREEQLSIFEVIQLKQQAVNDERDELEHRVKQLSQLIESERVCVQQINQNITRMCLQINKQQNIEKSCSAERKLSRKRSENYFSEVRLIEQELAESNKNKELIASNIQEENYLINMYIKVIQEMRSQLKIEQAQKIELTKKLVLLSKAQKMSAKKYTSKQALNNQYFTSMHESLSKWVD